MNLKEDVEHHKDIDIIDVFCRDIHAALAYLDACTDDEFCFLIDQDILPDIIDRTSKSDILFNFKSRAQKLEASGLKESILEEIDDYIHFYGA